jgi:hypothetical protein
MKKLAVAIAALALAATPVLACPGHEESPSEVKTAEKQKDTSKEKTADQSKAKADDNAKAKDTQKPADNKTAKPAEKKAPDKVSAK